MPVNKMPMILFIGQFRKQIIRKSFTLDFTSTKCPSHIIGWKILLEQSFPSSGSFFILKDGSGTFSCLCIIFVVVAVEWEV